MASETDSTVQTQTNSETFSCDICKQSFANKQSFFNHMRTHGVDILLSCKYCDNFFTEIRKLKSHMKKVHQKDIEKEEQSYHAKILGKKQLFSCNECEASFANTSQLESHKWVHIKRRRFTCTICGKGMTSKSSIEMHLLRKDHVSKRVFSVKDGRMPDNISRTKVPGRKLKVNDELNIEDELMDDNFVDVKVRYLMNSKTYVYFRKGALTLVFQP